uniref:Uncharacterized protein n=1 Tax=Kalanchoe fedtschenkoi TaxID=63787 RepID=A0A7N0RF26_KALFE
MEESGDQNQGKIRKRGCSSSSSSSLVRKYRFKRAILVGKRVAGGTPVPTPKMTMSRSPVSGEGIELLKFPTSSLSARNGRDGVVSARRLAATLWEINEVPSPLVMKESGRAAEARKSEIGEMSSDPSRDTLPEVDGSGFDERRRRKSAPAPESQKLLLLADHKSKGERDELYDNSDLLEMETRKSRPQFKDVCKGLTTAKELLKVLSHIWRLEEKHSSSAKSLVSALRAELDRVSVQVDQLAYEQRSYRREMKYAMQHLAEERAAWRAKVRDKVSRAVELVGAELDAERKLRRQAERLNKKLGRELAEGKARLDKALRELECERRAKDVLEQVCDELAKGIGDDRAEVEELKRASEKAWEEVEKEREMLQLADVLREERVQMKLAEAKYHFEEKNADIEKLKSELEAYMSTKGGPKDEGDESPRSANSEVLRDFLRKTLGKACQNPNIEAEDDDDDDDGEVDDGEECEEEDHDSGDSDLHSIELEMDDNRKTYKWGYSPPTSAHDDSKRSSVEVFKGRKSLSEKIQWATISLLKGGSASKDDTTSSTAPKPQKDEVQEGFEKRRSSSSSSQSRNKDQEDQMKKHKSIKSLKKQILSSFKLGSSQGYASPARQWSSAVERS